MEGLTRTEEAMLQQRLQKRQVKEFMNTPYANFTKPRPILPIRRRGPFGGKNEIEGKEKLTASETSQIFGNVVDHCFNACIDDFTSKTLSSRENGCITRCVQKQMFSQQRLSERFQEHNAEMTAKMQQQ
ncbi:hypothetical protein ACHAO5_000781 [Verticillium nonalfalfae]